MGSSRKYNGNRHASKHRRVKNLDTLLYAIAAVIMAIAVLLAVASEQPLPTVELPATPHAAAIALGAGDHRPV